MRTRVANILKKYANNHSWFFPALCLSSLIQIDIMRYLRSGLFFGYLLLALSSCAQGKYGIKKIQAFHRQHMPGTIRATTESEPALPVADTIHIIYIETKGPTATWEWAWWRNRSYSISASLVPGNKINAGNDLNGNPVTISAGKGNQLWMLQLSHTTESVRPVSSKKKDEILLQGKFGAKVVTQVIKSSKQLQLIPSSV